MDPCHTAENVKLRELDLHNKMHILLVEIVIVLVDLLGKCDFSWKIDNLHCSGLAAGFFIARKCTAPKKIDNDDDAYQMISMTSSTTIL